MTVNMGLSVISVHGQAWRKGVLCFEVVLLVYDLLHTKANSAHAYSCEALSLRLFDQRAGSW